MDDMISGMVSTYMANSVITGSAAAATAFATGHKTTVRFLGIGPRTDDLLTGFEPTADPYEPIASVLEGAKLEDKATGIIATSRITHATPAAYACHIEDRGWDNEIMEHIVYENIDVVFGGGFRHLIPTDYSYTTTFGDTWNGKRTDGENLHQVLLDNGYQFVDNKDDMIDLESGKVWGLFDDSHMDAEIDRLELHPSQPSLSEMTEKAIDLLSQDKDGFFLMVEGSQIDWAGHNNDPIYMITDFIEFDEAVKVAMDFAKDDGKTLVLVFPDHDTGAISIGTYEKGYTSTTIEDLIDVLKGMKLTSGGVEIKLDGDYSDGSIIETVEEWWGITLTAEDIDAILELEAGNAGSFNYALARYISAKYTYIGWTTHGHNGMDVPLWSYGPNRPIGYFDNTELAEITAEALGVNLEKTQEKLFVEVDETFTDWHIDESDPENLVLIIEGKYDYELPISKNLITYKGKTTELEGIVVYAPNADDGAGDIFIPMQAVKIIK
jgi:alkaline phosphatase